MAKEQTTKPKTALGFGILDFFTCGWILNQKDLSPIQKVILKSIMGEELDATTPIKIEHPYQTERFENEVEMYKYFTGKESYEAKFHSDINLLLGRRGGKCESFQAPIQLADGSVHKIGDLVGRDVKVIAWDQYANEYLETKAKVHDNGLKSCSLIKTKYGQELERTDNHPLFTINGWASIDGSFYPDVGFLKPLKVGDRIAVPINNPIEGNIPQRTDHIKLLAYLLADGSFAESTISYTLCNLVQKQEILNLLDGTYKIYVSSKNPKIGSLKIHHNNSIHKLIKDLNLNGTLSHTKFIPNWVYQLPNKQVALFLNRLISTDGWACVSDGKPEIGFSSVSKDLAYGVKRLLARIGIISNIFKSVSGYKKNDEHIKCKDRYTVAIDNNSEIIKFIERIGFYGKDEELKRVIQYLSKNSFNCQIDTMPLEFCQAFANKLYKLINYSVQERRFGRIRPDRCASKERLMKYVEMFPNEFKEERKLLELDFYWDTITEITSLGEQPTAGLEVPEYHTYVNDVIEHNSTLLGAGLALYFATQYDYTPYLRTSPTATIPLISPTKEQASEVYKAIKTFIMRSPYLFNTFLDGRIDGFQEEYNEEDATADGALAGWQIRFNNKVTIKVMAADISKIRGMAVPFAILDEICFFGHDLRGNDSKNTDRSIYEALAPALTQFRSVEGMAAILKISSPNGQSGIMFEAYEARRDPDVLHFQVPTWYANPKVSVSYLEEQKKKGIAYFNREYGAEYTAAEASYLDPVLVDNCILRGVERNEPIPQFRYVAAMDYATKEDFWYFGIGHKEYQWDALAKEKKERVYVDLLLKWKGMAGKELDPTEIIPTICHWMKVYRVGNCISDQYAFAALRPLFHREGCNLKEFKISTQSKLKYMYSLQVAVNSGILKIVHDPTAVRHLKDLREKQSTGGRLRIEHSANCHDDAADVIGLIIYQFDKTSPIYVGVHRDTEEKRLFTKDAAGQFVAFPSAQDMADHLNITDFNDGRLEEAAKKEELEHGEPEPSDDETGGSGGFFWSF